MRAHGMTLLELVVAMAVGLLVVTVSAQAVRQSWDARDRVRAESDRLATARAAFLLVTRDLEQTRPGDLRIERRPGALAPDLDTSADVPAPVLVSYWVRDHVLSRRERLRFAAREETDEIPLLGGVRAFDVRCLAEGEWHPAWDRSTLPEACRVTLELPGDLRLDTLVIPAAREGG